ncbi:MAG: FecR domain-containing protein [Bacteroidota bacterium]
MEQDRLMYLFDQYSNNSCNDQELNEFMEMVNSPENIEQLSLIMDKHWGKIKEREIGQEKSERILKKVFEKGNLRTLPKSKSIKWIGWAATFFLISTAGVVFYYSNNKPSASMANNIEANVALSAQSKFITLATVSEHQRVMLPDGSVVILNHHSSITYPRVFSSKREVKLIGEGYFDIKHDLNKTFVVLANKIKTTVLGTAFNIKAYEADQEIEVTVTRGKVGVEDENKTLAILKPNQQIVFNKTANKSALKSVVSRKVVLWQEGDLFFDDVSMEEAMVMLSKKFNTPIIFSDERAKRCRFSATFLKGESLEEILKIVCNYNNAQYQVVADNVIIKGQGCE